MSQTIYMRHDDTGEIKELADPKSSELIPLMNSRYSQISESDAKQFKAADAANAAKTPVKETV